MAKRKNLTMAERAALARELAEHALRLAKELEDTAVAIEQGNEDNPERTAVLFALDGRRIEAAFKEWTKPGPIRASTWHGIASVKYLDEARARLLARAPGFDEAPVSAARIAAVDEEANRAATACRGNVEGLARIARDAWASAIGDWRGMNRKGRPPRGGRAPHDILFALLKSARLARDVTSARNLGTAITRAIRTMPAMHATRR
jgi:hypothetical protein